MRSFRRRACLFIALLSIAAMLLLGGAPVRGSGQGGGRPATTPRPTPRPTLRSTPKPPRTPAPRQKRTAPQIEMVLIPAGTFMMGSPDSETRRISQEAPSHQVTVRIFYMGKYEVTQAQYQAVMGTNPSSFKGDNHPVDNVSWEDAVEFCRRLSQMTGTKYRLPSEAEWEYSCRAGTTTPFAFGSSLSSEQANFDGNLPYGETAPSMYRRESIPVGSLKPNAFGLYDMHGNVSEWCQDLYHDNYHGAPVDGSAWEKGGNPQIRVKRGGAWQSAANGCRSAYRIGDPYNYKADTNGFRVVSAAQTQ